MTHDLRILMLEDSAGDAALLERELRQGGMSFLSRRVETRDAFLAQLEEFDPDLVISDYRLPAFDGLQALELVRARGPELPFILISGHVGEERATEALKNGATDFILKGRVGRLVPAVQRALREVRERTERRRLEERFRLIVEATPNAMIMINTDGMIDMVNGETERMFGYEREELLGRGIEMLLPERFRSHHPQMREAFFATPRARRMGTGDALFGRRRDGSEIPLEIGLSPIDTGDGIQVLSVIVDITARYEIEREREQKQRELLAARDAAERASRAKSHFLAGMSHELRTPLNGVLGYARLLRMEGGLNAVQAARVDAMLVAGNHLLEMIHCVLDLSEIETERALSQATDVDLREIASACLDLVRPTAAAKDLVLSLSVPSDMPDRVVLDPMRLRQVLLNLLSNAVKFTNRGMVELRASAVDDGKLLRFEVADTGPGIPDDQRHRLFQNFERLGADKRGSIEGAGLGLSLSARLATLISGRIGHVPNPGGGSIFWLELPLVRSTAPAPAQAATAEPEEPSPPRSLHVLVVDDVAMNREIAASFLEATGHKVMSVEGGAEAIAAVAETDFSVVLMDVRMPEMDGLEATRRIRALGGARGRVPIVALTAQAFTEQVAECRKAGMDSHLAKPFDLDQLVAAVVRATSMGRADAEVPDPVASAAPVDPEPEAPLLGLELQVLDSKAFERTSSFLAPTMVDSHMRTIAGKVEALLRGLRGPDAISRHGTELGSEAHSLAGSAGMFGFARIAALGRRFEKAVQSGSAEAPALAAGLIAALEATLQIIYDRTSTAVDA